MMMKMMIFKPSSLVSHSLSLHSADDIKSIADDVTMTWQLVCDHMNNDI